jgi:hypothetical protein
MSATAKRPSGKFGLIYCEDITNDHVSGSGGETLG